MGIRNASMKLVLPAYCPSLGVGSGKGRFYPFRRPFLHEHRVE